MPADYAITHNLTPFISMQNHYSLVYREEEREMFPTLKLFGVGSIPWSPLARGLLTRPIDQASKRGNTDWSAHMSVLLRLRRSLTRESTNYSGSSGGTRTSPLRPSCLGQ